MESGVWVWDNASKGLKFERDKSKTFDLKSMAKFKYKRKSLRLQKLAQMDKDKGRLITLDDVKRVAVGLISAESLQRASRLVTKLFDHCCSSSVIMDSLLWSVLKYYASLLAYRTASSDERLKSDGQIKKQAIARLSTATEELRQSESNLSAAYVLLISGVSNHYIHHSMNGGLRYSRTLFDQQFYEILYEYLMLVTWVTFEYRNWEDIHSELGSILRSEAFNKDIPASMQPDEVSGQHHRNDPSSLKLTEKVEYNRPGAGSLNKLKSPLAEILHPTLLETKSLGKPLPTIETANPSTVGEVQSIGIIGDLYTNYISDTLQLKSDVKQQRIEAEEERKLLEEKMNNFTFDESSDEEEYDEDYD